MYNSVLEKRIKSLKKEMLNVSGELIEVDIINSIDPEKSDAYGYDKSLAGLRFLYKRIHKLDLGKLDMVLGKIENYGERTRLIPTLNENADSLLHRAVATHSHFFRIQDIDGIHVNLVYSMNECNDLYISFINKYAYEILQSVKNDGLFYSKEAFDKECRKALTVSIKQNRVVLSEENGIETLWRVNMKPYSSNRSLDCSLSFKNSLISIGSTKLSIPRIPFVKDENIYVQITNNCKTSADVCKNIDFKDIELIKEKGYIYLKPLKIPYGNYKCGIIYSGTPYMEHYCSKSKDWARISGDSVICIDSELLLRLDMGKEDRVYGIYCQRLLI